MKTPKEAFDFYDENKKGYLTSHELKCCVIYLTGTKLSKVAMHRFKDKGNNFEFQDLVKIVQSQIQEDPASEIFNAIDLRSKGYISFEDFDELCSVHAKHIKAEIRTAVFQEVDSNKDGMVTLRDIQRLVKFSI